MGLTTIKFHELLKAALIVLLLSLGSSQVFAQTRQIKGLVLDGQNQSPIAGATIKLVGTEQAASSDQNGTFTISTTSTSNTLSVSSVGYETKTATAAANGAQVTIVLTPSMQELESVVVTALGINRAQKSLTYSTQQVNSEELNRVKSPNLINTLNGKVAGVNIAPSSSGPGGSAKVVLRGNKSASGNNQVLYVIDGVPINNSTLGTQPSNVFGGERDPGDPIALINPEDIENISILKGASAAALYGSQAANGVILVTTKSGKQGRTVVNFSSSATLESPAYTPEFQNKYGQGSNGVASTTSSSSWGEEISGQNYDNVGKFFRTGNNFTNSITLSGGNEKNQTYFSYSNTQAQGITPNNDLSRHNFNFKESANFFNDKLKVEGGANYITQKLENAPQTGFYFNPIVGLYLLPRSIDISPYKEFEKFNPARNLYDQNWFSITDNETTQQNPWWIVNRNQNSSVRNRLLLNGSAKYTATPWLSVQARGSLDRTSEVYERKVYAGTQSILSRPNGRYDYTNTTITQQYADLVANVNFDVTDKFKISGVVGTSITDWKTEGVDYNSGQESLKIPNVFTLQNSTTPRPSTLSAMRRQLQSVFASANLSYDNWLYLDLTARNDWSSTLAFTGNKSFFYPSAGLGVVLNDKLNLPSFINMAKIRGSFAQVGNDLPPYTTLLTNRLDPYAVLTLNDIAFLRELKPEMTNSLEIGTEWRMWNNRLGVDVTYYKTNTKNQFFKIAASQASFYNQYAINAGNIQNQGIEALISLDAVKSEDFNWTTSINYSYNKNKIIELDDRIKDFSLTGESRNNYASKFEVGGSFGDIYGQDFQKDDQGRIIVSDGIPQKNSNYTKLGNANPLWQMGWNNNFSYKNLSLSFLIDGKFDYEVMSVTQAVLDGYGVSKASGDAREAGGVAINGVTPAGVPVTSIDANKWYTSTGGIGPVTSNYIYDGTVVRLRELTLGYDFNIKQGFIKKLKVSAVGRNLFYISKKAPFDPEVTMSTGNTLSGVDIFMMPATRNYGLTLNATF
ncbi:SusC/RagA family TonB-linked outer membrane protein [Sphingobacterium spiritivorum]|uniref:SusC/RagA family TonB-linked outer membrane protein n=1 Tax=Sphingobacterium spiritivorum TaxID=258 RepID=UPI003DA4AE34